MNAKSPFVYVLFLIVIITFLSTTTVTAAASSSLEKRTNECQYKRSPLLKRNNEPPKCPCSLARAVFTQTITGFIVLAQNECGATTFVGQFFSGFVTGHNYTFEVVDSCGRVLENITNNLGVVFNNNGGTEPFTAKIDNINLNCDNHGILANATSSTTYSKRHCTSKLRKRVGEPGIRINDDGTSYDQANIFAI